MLNKFKAFCGKPITWGAYFKLCGISVAGSLLVGTILTVKTMHDYNMLPGQKQDEEEQDEA